jgi:hypothetical protein
LALRASWTGWSGAGHRQHGGLASGTVAIAAANSDGDDPALFFSGKMLRAREKIEQVKRLRIEYTVLLLLPPQASSKAGT